MRGRPRGARDAGRGRSLDSRSPAEGPTRRPRTPRVPPGWCRSSPGPSTAVEPPSPAPSPSWFLHRTSLLGRPKGLLPRSEMLPVTKRRARRPHPAVALFHLRLLTRGPPAGRGWFTPRASSCHLRQQPPPNPPAGPAPGTFLLPTRFCFNALRPFCPQQDFYFSSQRLLFKV